MHLSEVEKLWTDEVLNSTEWNPFINRLLDEWQEFVLFVRNSHSTIGFTLIGHYALLQGTVLLNANVAFLGVPYVGQSAQADAAQLSSYLSIVASVGTIVVGLLLIRQNRKSRQALAPDEVVYHALYFFHRPHSRDVSFYLGRTSREVEITEVRDGAPCSTAQCSLCTAYVGVRTLYI